MDLCKKKLIQFCFLLFFFLLPVLSFGEELYILVDKGSYRLFLNRGEETILAFPIGYGLKSTQFKTKKGDFLTPEGIYEIIHIRPSQNYYYFLELSYPNFNDLSWAYFRGEIELEVLRDCENFIKCTKRREIQRRFGNEIGMHGGGAKKIERGQENFHWTQGCIASDNQNLEQLLKWVKLYQRVYILDSNKPLFEILKKLAYPEVVKSLDYWEGGLYLKVDEKTYWYFKLLEKYNGLKFLEWQEWKRGLLTQKMQSSGNGRFEEELENYLKRTLLRRINYIYDPLERKSFEEWK